jgi:uncharacterized protein YndB with AHSA1/START domain
MIMETTDSTGLVVRKSITVNASQEHAFKTWVDGLDSWWPRSHHIGDAEMAEAIIEPRVGGRAYERGVDGGECDWGVVLAYEPPSRIVVSWQIGADWKYDPDESKASEYEVRFIPEGPDSTLVEFEHRNLERHGPDGRKIFEAVGGEGGWGKLMELFAEKVASTPAR